jgi:hypothetical protein
MVRFAGLFFVVIIARGGELGVNSRWTARLGGVSRTGAAADTVR